MGRRIEVELTSSRDDGSWTWRAAGAKQPKGDVQEALLYDGAKVGDVVKVEAEFHIDGIEITEVFAPKTKKERTNLLEMKTRALRDDELVTTKLAKSEKRDRKGGRDRGRGRGRDDDRGSRRGPGSGGGSGSGGGGGERRGPRPEEADRRPRPKRLRPRRVHRDALLAEVTEEHRTIVEQVIKDGMPGIRAAVEKQNAEAKEAGKPEIDATPILAIAEKNLGKARLAECRDRADAALADATELDIRDLRSVVVAGADVARDEESRALAEQIKKVLDERLESDHATWLADLSSAVTEGRVVRGLRLSSRPVKAGAPLPTEIASKLAQQASDALAADVMQDRWETVLDALAFSPVRGAVTPVGIPAEPTEGLLSEIRRLSDRIPTIAALFGIDPAQVPKSAKRRRPPRKGQKDSKPGAGGGAAAEGGAAGRRDDRPKKPKKPKIDRPHPGAEPKDEEPTAQEAPADAEATAEEPATDEASPSTDETAADQTAPGAVVEESAAAAEPVVEEPAAHEAQAEEPAAQLAAAEEPAAQLAAAEEPAAQLAAAEEPAAQLAAAEEPAAEEAGVDDSAPVADQAAAEEPETATAE